MPGRPQQQLLQLLQIETRSHADTIVACVLLFVASRSELSQFVRAHFSQENVKAFPINARHAFNELMLHYTPLTAGITAPTDDVIA